MLRCVALFNLDILMIDTIIIIIAISVATYGIQRILQQEFERVEDVLLTMLAENHSQRYQARREKC